MRKIAGQEVLSLYDDKRGSLPVPRDWIDQALPCPRAGICRPRGWRRRSFAARREVPNGSDATRNDWRDGWRTIARGVTETGSALAVALPPTIPFANVRRISMGTVV